MICYRFQDLGIQNAHQNKLFNAQKISSFQLYLLVVAFCANDFMAPANLSEDLEKSGFHTK